MSDFRWADTRACPRCATALPATIALCAECRTLTSPSGSLGGADLRAWDLGDLDLRGVDLGGARLQSAKLCRARLDGANLSRAVLAQADLTDAVLTDANLDGADLRRANMQRTIVAGASLHRTVIDICYAETLEQFRGTPSWIALDEVLPSGEPRRFTTFDNEPIVCPKCRGEHFVAVDTKSVGWFEILWFLSSWPPRKAGTEFQLVCDGCSASVWHADLPLLR